MSFSDRGHRPHADYKNERPVRNEMVRGPASLRVTMDTWGPKEHLFTTLYDELQSNWGHEPSRTFTSNDTPCRQYDDDKRYDDLIRHHMTDEHKTGWCRLTDDQQEYVRGCFAGRTLPQVLEGISFHFCIDGVDRATTHQLVRTRIGAAFMQHGGRDNDWRHRRYVMPETIYRALKGFDGEYFLGRSPVTDIKPLEWFYDQYVDPTKHESLWQQVDWYLQMGRNLYAALVDAGVPWQDARTLLWTGQETYIHAIYNYLALAGVIRKRHEFIMDWQINCVAQLMLREIRMKCPPVMSRYLGSGSDLAKQDVMAGLESWPPVGKYPNPHERCKHCGHAKGNHIRISSRVASDTMTEFDDDVCEACETPGKYSPKAHHIYEGVDTLPRAHRPEQNPFWVLHPDSASGKSDTIGWVATDGKWPSDFPVRPEDCEVIA